MTINFFINFCFSKNGQLLNNSTLKRPTVQYSYKKDGVYTTVSPGSNISRLYFITTDIIIDVLLPDAKKSGKEHRSIEQTSKDEYTR
jgi:hypothetical protein